MKLMNNLKRFSVGILGLWAVMGYGQNPPAAVNSGANVADQQTEAKSLVGKRGEQQVDLFTGSFGYSIPIACAPARNGSEPALALTYSSGGDNGWCGMGWKLDIGSIERNTKDGFPIQYTAATIPAPGTAYDDTKGFILKLFGKEIKLLSTATANEYRAEVDTDFLRCVFDTSANKWLVYDKSGTIYYFGQTSGTTGSRVSKTGWIGAGAVFYWALDQIVTATGDKTTIAYTTYGTEKTIYPTTITYNGHNNGFPGLHTISFETEARPDQRFSYRWGFRTEQNRRLTNIVCKVNNILVRRYALDDYTLSTATKRSLLHSVTVYGSDNSSKLPTQVFTYQGNTTPVSFANTINWNGVVMGKPGVAGSYLPYLTMTIASSGVTVADLFDIDGDGLPDRVCWDSSVSLRRYRVQRNLGLQANGTLSFGTTNSFGPSSTGSGSTPSDNPPNPNPMPDMDDSGGGTWSALNSPRVRVRDINGDGLPDRIGDYWQNFSTSIVDYDRFEVMANNGRGFDAFSKWPLKRGQVGVGDTYKIYSAVESGAFVGLFDINGDGLPDRVVATNYSVGAIGPDGYYQVQFNTGIGFSDPKVFGPYKGQNYLGRYLLPFSGLETPNVHMMDINGDGLPDRVMLAMSTTIPGSPVNPPVNYFAVEYNNGYGFEAVNSTTTQPAYADKWLGVDSQTSFSLGLSLYQIQVPPYVGMFDLNGDGLPDRVMLDGATISSTNPKWLVCLNNGHGFDTGVQVGNIDNQGQTTVVGYWPNWFSMQGSAGGSSLTTLMDVNGDGLLDRVMVDYNNQSGTANTFFKVQLNQGPFPDLLTGINNGIGGSISVAYKSSTVWDNTKDPAHPEYGSQLPFPMQTVASVTESDGINAARTTTYDYAGGLFDGIRREFAGFAVVTNTEPLAMGATVGRKTITYFHQGGGRVYASLGEYADPGNFAKRGMPYRIETYGNEATPLLYKMVINQVDQVSLNSNGSYPNRYFPFISQIFEYDYPMGAASTPKINGSKFVYSTATGTAAADNLTERLTQKVLWGEVFGVSLTTIATPTTDVVPADTQYHQIHYATIPGNANIIDHPDIISLTSDAAGSTVVQQTQYIYNTPSGTVATKKIQICPGTYAQTSYQYDTFGRVNMVTDPVGVQTVTEQFDDAYLGSPAQIYPYKVRQRATVNVNNDTTDHISYTKYDVLSGQLTDHTDPMGVLVHNTYADPFFRLTKTERTPVGGTAIWVKQLQYNLGGINASTHDSANYVHVQVNNGDGTATGSESRTFTDGFGSAIQTVSEAEQANIYRRVSTAYDQRGVVFLTTWPKPNDSGGFAYSKPSGTMPATFTGFDAAGRVNVTRQRVDATFDANGAYTGRVTPDTTGDAVSPLAAKTWSYVKGTEPWWKIVTDEDVKIRRYQFDAFDRNTVIEEVDGANTYSSTLSYDLAGNVIEIINSITPVLNADHIYYGYDDAGNKVAMADPHLGNWTYERDAAGRLRRQTDAKGQTIVFTYDATLARLHTKQVYNKAGALTATTTYTYDTSDEANYTVYKGLLYKTVDSAGWEKNGYDSLGRLVKTTRHLIINSQDYTTSYTYNDGDKVASTVYPAAYPATGPEINYTYHPSGALKSVFRTGASATPYYLTTADAASFDEFGHVLQFQYGNGVYNNRSYFTTSKRLQTITAGTSPGSSSLMTKSYEYSAADDVKKITGTGLSSPMTVTYDDLHRVLNYGGVSSYTYNRVGNILTDLEPGGTGATYDYGAARKQAVKGAHGMTYLYDLCGNMIVRHGGSTSSQAMDYDAENRLTRFSQVGATVVEYGYADDGARLWKRVNQDPAQVQVWIGKIYEEKQDANGNHVLFHIFAGDQQVCTFEAGSSLAATGGDTSKIGYYYHEDNLNSSSVLSGADGSKKGIQQEINLYYPFGRTQTATPVKQASFQVSRQFTGQILDEETGLYYYNARYYDPELGRFIQPDDRIPDLSNPQSYNRYSYCLNNPLRYTDPDGHAGKEIADWWASKVNTGAGYITASPSHWIWNGTVGSVNSLVGGVLAPLGLGSSAGAVSGNPNATAKDYAIATVVETANVAAIVPVTAGAGKAVSTLVRAGEKEAVGELATELVPKGEPCFVAGTLIATEDGFKPIEGIQPGDVVWSFDETTGETALKTVRQTFVRPADATVELQIGTETVTATPEHPFWVEGASWTGAGSLAVGDILRTLDGEGKPVASICRQLGTVTVYNFEVADAHSYFVSKTGLLVHNACTVTRQVPRNELKYKPGERGNAPIGSDGKPVELHHLDQDMGNASPRAEMTRTDHRGKGNFSENHPNTGKTPSTVDRAESSSQHREHWKKEFDSGAFDHLPNQPK